MVIVEFFINFVVFFVVDIFQIKFFVNWMFVVNYFGEGFKFYEVVQVIGMDFCFKLGVGIFVGKDFMFMFMKWLGEKGEQK